jgi:RNA polymerase sigma-70 factor, ECF subfamily
VVADTDRVIDRRHDPAPPATGPPEARASASVLRGSARDRPGRDRGSGTTTEGENELNDAFVTYRAELTSLARRALGSPHLAEEVVQETFARAWRSKSRFDPSRGTLRTWLYSIERNLLADMARDRHRQELRDRKLGETPEAIGDHLEDAMASWQVEDAVRQLSPVHRAVIIEIYFAGRTSKELAERLAIPEGTIRSRLFYALKALRLILEERGWEA